MKIGNRIFDLEKEYYIMGILNVTPDSFSDGGRWNDADAARAHAEAMAAGGADIIDIGGESTRPGHERISAEEEIDRVCGIIEMLKRDLDIPVSLDTYKSEVAAAGIAAGADMINDIYGLKFDDRMAGLIASSKKPCVLMHNRVGEAGKGPAGRAATGGGEKSGARPAESGTEKSNACPAESGSKSASCLMEDIRRDLAESLAAAGEAGIERENIILDPGIGFAKTYCDNLTVMDHLEEIAAMGYPVLLGTSRKSMIGNALDLPVGERVEGTIATTVIGMMKGCHMFRVHDVRENSRAVKMTRAILSSV